MDKEQLANKYVNVFRCPIEKQDLFEAFIAGWDAREDEVQRLKAELWVARDNNLRTYDGEE